jgi:hypothetical protein
MNVLRIFLMAVAAMVGGLAVAGLALAVNGHWMIGGAMVVVGAPLAWAIYGQSRQYTIRASDDQKAQLEETVKKLAASNAGVVSLTAVMKATALTKDRAEQEMRTLIGRGVCEMDFGPNGEMLFRLTPLDEARAQLTAMSERKPS